METCLICGKTYDPMVDPDHEDTCEDQLGESMDITIKPDPKLKKYLEGLLKK